jgi:ABC-type sugar transport system substrate-binding protein/ABC-type glycerol-3-phosphate transport system substrate-binding protein
MEERNKMKKWMSLIVLLVLVLPLVLSACGPTTAPAEPTKPPEAQPTAVPQVQPTAVPEAKPVKIVVIGKSVHPYWSNVEKGVIAAGKDLGVETIFFVPPKEDVAAQIQTMETYVAEGVTGIAIAPSDPNALEPTMKKASDAGIFVTTLDTPPIDGSVSLVYIGTDNFTAGKSAGTEMAALLPNGGKVGIGRGSDTALNALQRTDGFLEGIKGTEITALEPVNDKEDAATALQLANSVISANPDLAGAFGVYAYNGPAWATAIKEAGLVGKVKLVSFDATTDIINGIKECVINTTVAQREYDMGYKSVQIIKLMAEKGKDAALTEMGAVNGVIDTGVDLISAATLKDYEAALDKKGIPHEWNTQGWDPAACAAPPVAAGPYEEVDPTGAKVLWWHNHTTTRQEGLNEMIAEFNASNEWKIEVTGEYAGSYSDIYDKMVTGIGANDPTLLPNLTVGYANSFAKYQLSDALVDMDEFVDSPKWGLTAAEKADFFPGIFEADVSPQFGDGHFRMGFPPNRSMEMLYYNADWLKEMGYAGPPKTWAEFKEMACKATDATAGTIGYEISTDASRFASMVFSRHGNYVKPDGSAFDFTNATVKETMRFMKELYDEGCIRLIAENYGDQTDFGNYKTLFTISSSSGLPFYDTAVKAGEKGEFQWSVAPLPYMDGGTDPVQNVYGGSVAVPKTTPEQELAAWLFVKWLTEPAQLARWVKISQYFPVRASVAAELTDYFAANPTFKTAYDLLPYSTFEAQWCGCYEDVRRLMSDAYSAILDGADIDATLQKLQDDANVSLKENTP